MNETMHGAPAATPNHLKWFETALYEDVIQALVEDGSLLDAIRQEIADLRRLVTSIAHTEPELIAQLFPHLWEVAKVIFAPGWPDCAADDDECVYCGAEIEAVNFELLCRNPDCHGVQARALVTRIQKEKK